MRGRGVPCNLQLQVPGVSPFSVGPAGLPLPLPTSRPSLGEYAVWQPLCRSQPRNSHHYPKNNVEDHSQPLWCPSGGAWCSAEHLHTIYLQLPEAGVVIFILQRNTQELK